MSSKKNSSVSNETVVLKAEPRPKTGGRSGLNLRLQGRVPAVLYGQTQTQANTPVTVSLDLVELGDALKTGQRLLNLEHSGQRELVLVKDVQLDHLSQGVLHVDFTRVDMTRKVRVPLRLELRGKARGLSAGGVLEHGLTEIEVECLPDRIPRESLKVPVDDMALDAVLHVRDLKLPEGLTTLTSADAVVATVKIPTEVAVTALAEGGPAAPEVIAKGKVDEAGAAAGGKADAKDAKAKK